MSIDAWMWDHPFEHGKPTQATLSKNDSLFAALNCQLFLCRGHILKSSPPIMTEI